MKKIILVLCLIVLTTTSVMAKGQTVISLGKDLNEAQRTQMKELLGADEDTKIIEVTNEEERRYLGKYVDSKIIGTRAISSAYVETLSEGAGIKAEVYNVTWVTKDMVINAVATAGIKDANVKVAAPFNVSGTAALTGIIKAFEDATGEEVSEEQKEVANEEIAKTGELGQDIGKDEATELVKNVKEEIIEKNITNNIEIEKVIVESAKELNITLTEEQKQKITELMERIANLDLNVDEIKSQVKNISDKLGKLTENSEEVKSGWNKIVEFFNRIIERLFGSN